jgi:hypothetical protein
VFPWDEIARLMPEFRRAILTAMDNDGYPCSVRCQPQLDAAAQRLRMQIPPDVTPLPGPASLLWHRHDEWLWRQKSFLVRGVLEQDAYGWSLRPAKFTPGVGLGGLKGTIRFVREARRTSDRYLAARNLARPRVPWKEIIAVKKAAKRANEDGSSRGA